MSVIQVMMSHSLHWHSNIATDPFVQKLSFFRVYSGTATAGSYVLNSTKDKKERFGRIVHSDATIVKKSIRFGPEISLLP